MKDAQKICSEIEVDKVNAWRFPTSMEVRSLMNAVKCDRENSLELFLTSNYFWIEDELGKIITCKIEFDFVNSWSSIRFNWNIVHTPSVEQAHILPVAYSGVLIKTVAVTYKPKEYNIIEFKVFTSNANQEVYIYTFLRQGNLMGPLVKFSTNEEGEYTGTLKLSSKQIPQSLLSKNTNAPVFIIATTKLVDAGDIEEVVTFCKTYDISYSINRELVQ